MRWIVVGAGAAGCVVAARLTECTRDDVLLLEAGPAHDLGRLGADTGPRPQEHTLVRPHVAAARRTTDAASPYVQGWGLGGSSLINGGVVTAPLPPELVGVVPIERPWSRGGVGEALLAADTDADEVRLVRRGGRRVTAADMFLAPLTDEPRLTVVSDVAVTRLMVHDRRVTGVITSAGVEHRADAVVLCAGAIETPAVLLRSGIDTPGVGIGVQDHPALRIAFDLDPLRFDPAVPAISVIAQRSSHQLLALEHVHPELPFGVLMVGVLRVESRGAVTVPDRDGPPLVDFNMLARSADRDRLLAAAADVVEVARRPAFRETVGSMYLDEHGTSIDTLRSHDDVARWAMTADLGGYHHVAASCRRGVVTDASGWVHGYEGLAIGDASLLDTTPVSDPYIAVLAQAHRLVHPTFLARIR